MEEKQQLMTQFEHRYSRKNDGSPSPYSAEQTALSEAFKAFHDAGHYEWTTITITKLECDQREDHYPDICWHYLITISINPTLKVANADEDYEEP